MNLQPKHILIASMPKAAGTYLLDSIERRSNLHRVNLLPGMDRREMEISNTRAILNWPRNYFTGAHLCASKATDRIIRHHGMKTLVLHRNLFDCAISLRDHVRRESTVFSMAYFDARFARMDDAELESAIVDLAMPWYFKFYLSWKASRQPVLFLGYRDVVERGEETFGRIAAFTGVRFHAAPARRSQALARAVSMSAHRAAVKPCPRRPATPSSPSPATTTTTTCLRSAFEGLAGKDTPSTIRQAFRA